jgi:TonB family protein
VRPTCACRPSLILPFGKCGNTMQGMKKLLRFLYITLLTPCLITPAHTQVQAHALLPQPSDMKLNVELLSDTNGANLDPYMRNMFSDLKKHWLPPVTETANQPLLKQQETVIIFTIAPDGRLLAMQLEDSPHNTALDKAAWNAVKGTPYSPLPTGMKGQDLKLRVHFMVNCGEKTNACESPWG